MNENFRKQRDRIGSAQWTLAGLIVAYAAGAVLYRVLRQENLGHSAAMFLGVPAVLAICLALSPKVATVTGGIVKGITLALLLVAPLLGEGYLCILVAAPLFYVVGIAVGLAADWQRRRRATTVACTALLLLPMCLEGSVPQLSFDRRETVQARRVVGGSASAVEQRLARSPDVGAALPAALRVGFPRPLAAWGVGLAVGDRRTIHFSGAEGDPPGDLVMRVAERRPGYLRFETVSDESKITQWVHWTGSEVSWRPLDATHTEVSWTVHFERQLDPSWYFSPWERGAVRQAAWYLIGANAGAAR